MLTLWGFAVAQPLYDVLRQNGDFFVAHRAQPLELVLFAAGVSLALPLVLALPYVLVAALWPRAGRVVLFAMVGLLSTALASQVMAHRLEWPTTTHFAVAALAGGLATWLYATRAPIRSFLTVLSISVLLFPAIFLLHPSMAPFVRAQRIDPNTAAAIQGAAPPIVFVIFDQLPLASLMDARGQIDRYSYPSFAALADNATWYRNASTMADYTGWALPPILTGLAPRANRVPTSKSYPSNLFTWLGGRYRLEVREAITQLCPDRLCDAGRDPIAIRLASMTMDASVVYAFVALPGGLRAHLPPLTENWKGFIDNQRWQRRWIAERDGDRRRLPLQLIDSISRDDPQPTLYFAHALLPHEPYVYLRTGQEFSADPRMWGARTGRWTTDEWPVTLAYRRHLLQVDYVDALLGRLIERLKAEGLYDDALIVVTSDHGVSFRPGLPFKGLEGDATADMVSVPLFIKAPRQRQGAIDDRNMQSMDVMPTIAKLLGVPLTWRVDGRPAGDDRPATKAVYYMGATRRMNIDPSWLASARDASVARKVALFGDATGWRAPAPARRDLIGRPVAELDVVEGPWQGTVDAPERLFSVSPKAPQVPVHLTGRIRDARGEAADALVAVAIEGVVAAVTRTHLPEYAPRGTWAALIDPARLKQGRNDIQVFVLPTNDSQRLHLAYASRERPETLDLASRGARDYWRVQQSGLYPREGRPVQFRWTNGNGELLVPLEADVPPRSLRIGLTGVRPGGIPFTLSLNDCTLFSGPVTTATWHRTFSLRDCPPSALTQPHLRIRLKSPSWTSPGDPRDLGVAVESLTLWKDDWPVTDHERREARGTVQAVDTPTAPLEAGTSADILVANTGKSIWMPATAAPAPPRPIQLALQWRALQRRLPLGEQRLDLPRELYPAERVVIDVPLVPPDELRDHGPWKVTIKPVELDGTEVPVDAALVIDVASTRASAARINQR